MKWFAKILFLCVSASSLWALSDASNVPARRRVGRAAKQLQPAGAAATADFLKNPEYCTAIKRQWKDDLVAFGDAIKEMLENEERYRKDYFVFYHAQGSANRILVEFLKNLYEFRNKVPLRSDFEYLRFWHDGSDYADVNSYLDSFGIPNPFSKIGDLYDGGRADIRAALLSVNPVLFGHFYWDGECTFNYFLHDKMVGPFIKGELQKLFDYYGFDKGYIKGLFEVSDQFETRTGDIVQIFVPKNVVNDCAYLCEAWGIPMKNFILDKNGKPLALNDYDVIRERYAKCDGILNVIQNDIGVIKNAPSIQLRLFFSKSGPLLNPGLDAKMFRFTTLAPLKLADYKKQIRALSHKIFAGHGEVIDRSPAYAPLFVSGPAQAPRGLTRREGKEVKDAMGRIVDSPLSLPQRVIKNIKSKL